MQQQTRLLAGGDVARSIARAALALTDDTSQPGWSPWPHLLSMLVQTLAVVVRTKRKVVSHASVLPDATESARSSLRHRLASTPLRSVAATTAGTGEGRHATTTDIDAPLLTSKAHTFRKEHIGWPTSRRKPRVALASGRHPAEGRVWQADAGREPCLARAPPRKPSGERYKPVASPPLAFAWIRSWRLAACAESAHVTARCT